jgi:hypothetical protein
MRIPYLLCFLLTLCPTLGWSQPFDAGQPLGTDNQMTKVGQMFTVTVRPGAKKIEVHVVGNEVATANFSDPNLIASIKIGRRSWQLSSKKIGDKFIVDPPADFSKSTTSELRLKIQGQDKKNESFDFNLSSPKP